MVRSPHSRGSGKRHPPGRPGGANRQPPVPAWRARTTHSSALADLPLPHARLWCSGPWGLPVEELAYKIDQALAAAAVPYYPEQHERYRGLALVVPKELAERASASLAALLPPPRTYVSRGFRSSIQPSGLSRRDADHPWIFCEYSETLEDGRRYGALYFRDLKHRQFGRVEWILASTESGPHHAALRKLAHRLVTDSPFRSAFLSDDPELAAFWK